MTEKEYKKEGQVKQVVEKLYQGDTEAYIKWKMKLGHVLKNRPCESPKANLNMVKAMLDRDIMESWKLWCKTESKKGMEGTFQKKDTGETYKKKYKKGDSDELFKYFLGKVSQRFIKKYDTRKQKA